MVAAVGFDIENADDIWIPDWGVEIELDLDVCQELGIVWLPNLNAVGGGLLFDQKVANHGTLTNGPTWTKGKFGEPAISFNGSNYRIALASSFTGTVYSVSLWVNTSDTDAVLLGGSGSAGLGRVDYCPYIDGTNIYHRSAFAASGGATFVAHGGFSGWTHFAVTRNGTAISFYKNGAQLSTTQTQDNNNSSTFTTIGDFGDGTVPFAGSMASILFSGSCLTANQIAELYRNPFLLYWQPSRASFFDMRYDPSAYERNFRVASGGSWNDVSDSLVADSAYATCETYDTVVPLEISDEGRLIPSAPTGFQLEIDAFASTPDSNIYSVEVFKNGVSVWSEFYGYGVNNLTSSLATYTWGNSTELFDTTWTTTDAFSVTIQFYIGANATDTVYVDGARLTTWYSDGSAQTVNVPVGLIKVTPVAPTTRKSAAVPIGLAKLLGITPTTLITAAVPIGLTKAIVIAPATSKSAAVPAGLVDVTPVAPTTAKLAAVSFGAIDVLGITPTTAKSASVGIGLIEVAAFSLDGTQSVAVGVGLVDVASFAASTSKSASVAVGLVDVTGVAPSSSKTAAVGVGLVDIASVAISTLMTVSVDVGLVEVVGVTVGTAMLSAVPTGLIELAAPLLVQDAITVTIATIHYTLPDSRLGYTLEVGMLDYTLPGSRPGASLEEN